MKRKLSITINLFVGLMSIISWLFMAVFTKNFDKLSSGDFSSLKYFTVLSNLMNGVVSLFYVYFLISKKKITKKIGTLKLISASAVGLTFFTVIVFLGPLYGYKMMFSGSNLWMHLILPVLTLISFIFFEKNNLTFKSTFYSVIPTIIYSVCYVANIIINGIGEWPNRNDFYSFLYWGNIIGAIIAFVIVLITLIISITLYKLSRNK